MTDSFNSVRRGYDPAQVDETLRRMRQTHSATLQESAEKTVEVNRLQAALEQSSAESASLREEIASLQQQLAQLESSRGALSYTDLGPRISQILTLADEEADELRSRATAESQSLIADARTDAERIRTAADNHAIEARSRADAEAARILEQARREADDLLDHADRESSARRREAEAVYEQQRAAAAAAAADFEKTLATRREKSSTEFSTQLANQERALAAASEKLEAAEEEAVLVLRQAQADADAERERASAEAQQLLDAARIHAERVRRDSERELQALAARRDSITEQLTNVRQMLTTLSGGAVAAAVDPQVVEEESGLAVGADAESGELAGDGEGAAELASLEEQ
ncbi:DivIVA domain-containing protein [Tessaracoccus sp. OS52]|uniref:DivIVA domain-containing protein n=1 Tax=Tessaracoccus sp. OS52 TaxID=2886691 RepID=UPI001D113ACA|nr:DivIVA domain-containing protein [Tessaracoccus sp. OS52]MCC2592339.1 DivIVA domain-containing protein [Tessaracoccus sp. OS52]